MKSNTQIKIDEAKNWTLRKSFLMRRVSKPNNVLDRSKKFVIEDLYIFPKTEKKEEKVEKGEKLLKRNTSASNVALSEFEQKQNRRMTRKRSEIFTINPNLNSNFTINTFSLSNMRLRKYTYNPKQADTKLKVVIAGSKFFN